MSKNNIQAIFQIVAVLAMFKGAHAFLTALIGVAGMGTVVSTFNVGDLTTRVSSTAIFASATPVLVGFVLYQMAPQLSRGIVDNLPIED